MHYTFLIQVDFSSSLLSPYIYKYTAGQIWKPLDFYSVDSIFIQLSAEYLFKYLLSYFWREIKHLMLYYFIFC